MRTRRNLSIAAGLGFLAWLLATAVWAQAVTGVGAVGFTVGDLDAEVAFFTSVLDFERLEERELAGEPIERLSGVFGAHVRQARLRLGREELVLTEFLAPRGRPFPIDFRSNDRAFQHVAIVVSDMAKAYARLRQHRVRHVSTAPQRLPDWNPNAGGIEAFYFQDPEGHVLELIHFPPGKGDPRWQQATNRLFLGIDHTAIGVADSSASLALYRDALGLAVAGTSENFGPEQERLNQVFGAHLKITGLRAASGPGIEFLEYLSPSNGRPAPVDLSANDLLHWQTELLTADPAALAGKARGAGGRWVSPGAVDLSTSPLGGGRGFLVRDGDGHGLLLVSPR